MQLNEQYDAVAGADALVLVSEWRQSRKRDLKRIVQVMRKAVIVDGREQYELDERAGGRFRSYSVGRGRCVSPN
jgi:UDPglucose 6-dehydrogenase